MNIKQIKTKLTALDTPGVQQVLLDALCTYIGEARGEEVDIKHLTEMAEAIVYSLRREYLAQLPKKEPKVVQRDLEDLIVGCKNVPIPGSADMSRLLPLLDKDLEHIVPGTNMFQVKLSNDVTVNGSKLIVKPIENGTTK